MAFSHRGTEARNAPLAEINMIPLIDVMLVLLVIFIVTAPLLTHAVKLDLPKASSARDASRPGNVQVALRADGSTYWNGTAVTAAELEARLAEAGRQQPVPELRLRADRQAPYEKVAQVLSAAARHGLTRLGLATEPDGR